MKKLLLLRHAQTLSTGGLPDIERKLTPKGKEDALALGRTMKNNGYQPDLILCSSAKRTKETLNHVMETLEKCAIKIIPGIYNGTRKDLFRLIQNVNDDVKTLMLIGHNPVIHTLIATLSLEKSTALMNRLMSGYPPGTISTLNCPCKKWADIQVKDNPLTNLMSPLDYNAPATPTRWT